MGGFKTPSSRSIKRGLWACSEVLKLLLNDAYASNIFYNLDEKYLKVKKIKRKINFYRIL